MALQDYEHQADMFFCEKMSLLTFVQQPSACRNPTTYLHHHAYGEPLQLAPSRSVAQQRSLPIISDSMAAI